MKHCIDSLGNIITSRYNRINAEVTGSGKEVILLLARKTSPAPILEMKPLAHFLKDKYTVITLDYLGSGSSDNYHCDRTLENITNEIHEVMEVLGYTHYTITAHAYAGLYSLYYANKYTDEVQAVIGIDSFVAELKDNETLAEYIELCRDMWLDFHESSFIQWVVEKLTALYLKKLKSYKYSEEDVAVYSNDAAFMLQHMTVLDEYKCPDENFETLRDVVFPSHMPVLFILSSRRKISIRKWYSMHKKLLQNDNSKIITLWGGKDLSLKHPERIAAEIHSFLSTAM